MRGTHLYNSFTCQPVCGPARACLQTGIYATATGAFRNGTLPPIGTPMLGDYFSAAGYRTGYIGNGIWSDGPDGPVDPRRRGGYQDWLASNFSNSPATPIAPGCSTPNSIRSTARLPRRCPRRRRDPLHRSQSVHEFFLFLSFIEPHHQNHLDDYPRPVGYAERYAGRWTPPDLHARRLVGATPRRILGPDQAPRRSLRPIARLPHQPRLYENTVILFTSDHGNGSKPATPNTNVPATKPPSASPACSAAAPSKAAAKSASS